MLTGSIKGFWRCVFSLHKTVAVNIVTTIESCLNDLREWNYTPAISVLYTPEKVSTYSYAFCLLTNMKTLLSIIFGSFIACYSLPSVSANHELKSEDGWEKIGECIGDYQDTSKVEKILQIECNSDYKENYNPNIVELRKQLTQKNIGHVASCIPAINLCGTNLVEADLAKSALMWADLKRSRLFGANLSGADLSHANLTGADIRNANLTGADLSYAVLQEANFSFGDSGFSLDEKGRLLDNGANLTRANLRDADLSGANLSYAVLNEVVFELAAGALPNIQQIAFARGLWSMTYEDSPHSLMELREAFKKAGFSQQEREVTCAIRRATISKIDNVFERKLNWLLFDLTSEYGMSPLRPLKILFMGIFVFSLPYMAALRKRKSIASQSATRKLLKKPYRLLYIKFLRLDRSGLIWIIWHPDRLLDSQQSDKSPLTANGFKIIWFGIYFSLLSAFHFGWKDLNVGNWITRIQPREYSLRATGWVRTISGLQSILSVYMLALWVLTYFGNPFE